MEVCLFKAISFTVCLCGYLASHMGTCRAPAFRASGEVGESIFVLGGVGY